MERKTKKQLETHLRRINSAFGRDQFTFDWTHGRPRLTMMDQCRDVSPRLSKREMGLYLEAFESGMRSTLDTLFALLPSKVETSK